MITKTVEVVTKKTVNMLESGDLFKCINKDAVFYGRVYLVRSVFKEGNGWYIDAICLDGKTLNGCSVKDWDHFFKNYKFLWNAREIYDQLISLCE